MNHAATRTPAIRDPLAPLDAALSAALELPIPVAQRAQVRSVHAYWADAARAVLKSVAHADLAEQHRDADALYAIAESVAREGSWSVRAAGRVKP